MFQKLTIKPQKYIILDILFLMNYMKQTFFMVCPKSCTKSCGSHHTKQK